MKLYLATTKNKKSTKTGDKCIANTKVIIQKLTIRTYKHHESNSIKKQ